jgi:hypothetical protein
MESINKLYFIVTHNNDCCEISTKSYKNRSDVFIQYLKKIYDRLVILNDLSSNNCCLIEFETYCRQCTIKEIIEDTDILYDTYQYVPHQYDNMSITNPSIKCIDTMQSEYKLLYQHYISVIRCLYNELSGKNNTSYVNIEKCNISVPRSNIIDDVPNTSTTKQNDDRKIELSNDTQVIELENKLKEINEIRNVIKFDFEKKKQEFDEERNKLAKEYDKLNSEKYKMRLKKEKDEEHKRMFEEGKKSYAIMKRQIMCGKLEESTIPQPFTNRFIIFKQMDKECLLGMPNEYDSYKKIENKLKFEQFKHDKTTYNEYRTLMNENKLDIHQIPIEFRGVYESFEVIDTIQNELKDEDEEYSLFLTLYAQYLNELHSAKMNLDDVSYLRDADIDPPIKINLVENETHKSLLVANTLGIDTSVLIDKNTSIENNDLDQHNLHVECDKNNEQSEFLM